MSEKDKTPTLAPGFAKATPPQSSVIHTPATGLATGTAFQETETGRLPLYFARPEGDGPFPVVLVVQEIFGVHEHIRDVCRRIARLGYFAVAPELYFRQGDPSTIADIQELLKVIVSQVPDAQVMADLDAAHGWAKAQGAAGDKFGITGFCWGGRAAWLYAAHQPALDAAVAWYGRLTGPTDPLHPHQPLAAAGKLHCPVLGLYGGADQSIPVETVDAMREACAKAGKVADLIVYPEAPHAFYADYRPSFREEPAEDGWHRLERWFSHYL